MDLPSTRNITCEVTLHNITPDFWNANTVQCVQRIKDDAIWHSIPLFNYVRSQNLKDQQLVRFRGMIQNMHNPEFFLCKYEVKNIVTGVSSVRSGKFKDTIVCKENERFIEDSEHNENSERETWLCVPIPALNNWVSSSWKKLHMKRQHCKSEEEDIGPSKRATNVTQMDTEMSTQPSTSFPTELVLPEPHCRTCYVKLYDFDTTSYVLNEIVEVAGFISFSEDSEDMDGLTIDGCDTNSKVPRLHVVACRKLSANSSLLPEISLGDEAGSVGSVRRDLHLILTQLLLGDTLAADYFLCHLVSSVYSRTDMMALGQLPLNISNIPKTDYVKGIYMILESLVVKSVFLPMSLESLNTKTLNPKKDYETDQICEGFLQLSPHTHLVLDETQMQPGKLEGQGVINMTALRKLITEQKVAYDFRYYQLDFNCDIPVLVFSEGKSILQCSVVVPLEPDATCLGSISEIFKAVQHFLEPQMLHRLRAYILSVQSSSSFIMNSEMEQVIQEDFVKLRQNKEICTSADDLHNLIVLARLMSLSSGEQSLSHKTWEKTLTLEMERKHRLASSNNSRSSQ